jgi:hypothetical protein
MMRAQVAGLTSIPICKSAVCMRHLPNKGFSWSLRISFLIASVALRGLFLALDFSSKPATPSSVQRWSVA